MAIREDPTGRLYTSLNVSGVRKEIVHFRVCYQMEPFLQELTNPRFL